MRSINNPLENTLKSKLGNYAHKSAIVLESLGVVASSSAAAYYILEENPRALIYGSMALLLTYMTKLSLNGARFFIGKNDDVYDPSNYKRLEDKIFDEE